MTARQQILRRMFGAYLYGLSIFPLIWFVVDVAHWLAPGPAVLLLMLLIFPTPFMLLLFRAACARCAYPFVMLGFWRLKWGSRRKRIDYCPHCRLPLDTPVADVVPNPKT